MNIKEFDYLEIALNELKNNKDDLLKASLNLENFFLELLNESYCDFSNISSRVKSIESLREKILRNHYYKRYDEPEKLIYKLSDLIGIRIECRFGDDEKKIYRFLKKYFNKKAAIIRNSISFILSIGVAYLIGFILGAWK
mgnify:CR=1 FL=1